jgi:peptidoglycan-associated lipoprotein
MKALTFHQINIYLFFSLMVLKLLSCVSVEKIRTGEQALERRQYAVAQKLLEEEIPSARGKEKAIKCFQLAEAYRFTNESEKALKWYLSAIDLGKEDSETYWWTAMMLKRSGDYQGARKILELIPRNSPRGADAAREYNICSQAENWMSQSDSEYTVKAITQGDKASIYVSDIYEDGQLVITSDQAQNSRPKYKWTGRYYSDIYLLNPELPQRIEKLPGWHSLNLQRGHATFNSDFSEMVYTLCPEDNAEDNFCQLYESKRINDEWSEGRPLSFNLPGTNYSHPHLSRDSVLFFSAKMKGGLGAYDIYYSIKRNKRWTNPVPLPSPINTPGNEKFPTVRDDTLYFSSDYLPGLGGLDIFKCYVRQNGEWSAPRNLKPPVNSGQDDFNLLYLPAEQDGVIAYASSSRWNAKGLDQVFSIAPHREALEEIVEEEAFPEKLDKTFKRFLSLRVVEQVFADPNDPNSRVIGKKPIGGASGKIEPGERSFRTRKDGRFITAIAFDSSYLITVHKEGYLKKSIKVNTLAVPRERHAEEIQTSSVEVILQKPYLDQEIVLSNIYYDLDQWYIREDAKPTLDQLISDLKNNPIYDVQIAAHTDCRADEDYNLELSEKRAESVVQYLLSKGIAADRLSYKGYGKSKLIEPCICEECTEKQHQKNRRTTFTLTERE